MPRTVIRNAHTIVAYDAARGGHAYIHDADIVFDANGFVQVGGRYDGAFEREISGRDRMVLPGFVNVHCHSGEEPISKSLFEDAGTAALWGQAMYEYSTLIEIGDDAVQAALTVMLGDLLRSGVTTFVDIAGPHDCWLPTLARSGARAYVAPGFREAAWHVEDSHRLDFRWNEARGREAFSRALETVDAAQAHPSGRLGGVVAPAQVETCSPELLQEAAEAARSRGVPITIHAAQTMAEHEELLRRHGLTAVHYLETLGILGPDLILGHCIFIDSHAWTRHRTALDLERLAKSGTSVAHCPVTFSRSGMVLQSLGRYRTSGVNVALGTDSYPFNMLEEMRHGDDLRPHRRQELGRSMFRHGLTCFEAWRRWPARRRSGRDDIGRIATKAPRRIFRHRSIMKHPGMQPVYDPLRNLLHCAAERAIAAVYVDGASRGGEGAPDVNVDYDGALEELQAAQDFAVRRLQANDPRGRAASELAPLSLPVLPHP
jgi:5-methylthioadenosine/S-adenosylhomocysteine deaminase